MTAAEQADRSLAAQREGSAPHRLYGLQGLYFLVTGIWPILNRRSFEAITGPKVDFWLVRTVGALVFVIGLVLTMAALGKRDSREVRAVSIGSALAFTAVDVNYVLRRRISPVYLADAALEMALLFGYLHAADRGRRRGTELDIWRHEPAF